MLLLYSHTISPRLQYIVDFVGKELFDDPIIITTDKVFFNQSGAPRINYSDADFSEQEFFIQCTPLLFETGIRAQSIDCIEVNYQKAFFQTRGDFSFDILAASFYLISRYEEYLPYEMDEYGRYAHTSSLAFKERFLQVPLVNIWLKEFKKSLQQKFPSLQFKRTHFKFIPSYDIDIAYSYLEKGFRRNAGGFIKSISEGKWHQVKERFSVLRHKQKDPYDAYEWLDALHLYCNVKPIYFFLVAQIQQGYDKNIPTASKMLQELIAYFAKVYEVGVHPSWQSSAAIGTKMINEEKEWLEVITEKKIMHTRQHYIKFDLPGGYRRLIDCGLLNDYSMGYGSINGFRASVASAFFWFDLEKNEPTALQIFPFCYMDANAFYEQKLSTQKAYEELVYYYNTVKKLNGLFITIWHNNFLGTANEYRGWKEMYELFMKENIYWDAYS